MKLKGIEEASKNIRREITGLQKDLTKTLFKAGLLIGREAQMRAPIDTGMLRRSMQVIEGGRNNVIISFGGELTTTEGDYDYAIIQHEELSFNHPRGGEAKFLENALYLRERDVIKMLQESTKGRFR